MKNLFYTSLIFILAQCQPPAVPNTTFHIHGHRGCRGLRPENTIPAFIHAMEWGVDALELDVVITGDSQVLVSHEPIMLPLIMANPDPSKGAANGENIYTMTTAEAQSYRCGTQTHPRFLEQVSIPTFKPLLRQVVDTVSAFIAQRGSQHPLYNIELKTVCEQDSQGHWIFGDDVYHPQPSRYAEIFLREMKSLRIQDHVVLQSFDPRILEALHQQAPDIPLVFLSEDTLKTAAAKLSELSFVPHGFSVYYPMIDAALVEYCQTRGIQLIAWTVNETSDIERLVQLGVQEIITDYPDRALEVRNKLGQK